MDNPKTAPSLAPELHGYCDITPVERDWILSGAVGYFRDLEFERTPGERISEGDCDRSLPLFRFLSERMFKRKFDRCLINLTEDEDTKVKLVRARSLGLSADDELVCLAALQFVSALRRRCRPLGRSANPPDDQLWAAFGELMAFCHTKTYALIAVYEEHYRRERINRRTPRAPTESYAEWRSRAAPLVTEMRPISVQFARQEGETFVMREDRTSFHRRWIDKQVAEGWQYGTKPYRYGPP